MDKRTLILVVGLPGSQADSNQFADSIPHAAKIFDLTTVTDSKDYGSVENLQQLLSSKALASVAKHAVVHLGSTRTVAEFLEDVFHMGHAHDHQETTDHAFSRICVVAIAQAAEFSHFVKHSSTLSEELENFDELGLEDRLTTEILESFEVSHKVYLLSHILSPANAVKNTPNETSQLEQSAALLSEINVSDWLNEREPTGQKWSIEISENAESAAKDFGKLIHSHGFSKQLSYSFDEDISVNHVLAARLKKVSKLSKATTSGNALGTSQHYSSVHFVAQKPFSTDKYFALLEKYVGEKLVRSQGLAWLNTRTDFVSFCNQCGESVQLTSDGTWHVCEPIVSQETIQDFENVCGLKWDGIFGDKHQEMCFVLKSEYKEEFLKDLNECLVPSVLSDEEQSLSIDPFPEWETISQEDSFENVLALLDAPEVAVEEFKHVHTENCNHDHDHQHDHAHGHSHNHEHDHQHDHAHGHSHDHEHNHDHVHSENCNHEHDNNHDHGHEHVHGEHCDHHHEHLESSPLSEIQVLRVSFSQLTPAALESETLKLIEIGELKKAFEAQAVGLQLLIKNNLEKKTAHSPLDAMKFYKQAALAVELGKLHNSLPFWRSALKNLEPFSADEPFMYCEIIAGYGRALNACNCLSRAFAAFAKGENFAKAHNLNFWQSVFSVEMGKISILEEDFETALEFMGSSEDSLSSQNSNKHETGLQESTAEKALLLGLLRKKFSQMSSAKITLLSACEIFQELANAAHSQSSEHEEYFRRREMIARKSLAELSKDSLLSKLKNF